MIVGDNVSPPLTLTYFAFCILYPYMLIHTL